MLDSALDFGVGLFERFFFPVLQLVDQVVGHVLGDTGHLLEQFTRVFVALCVALLPIVVVFGLIFQRSLTAGLLHRTSPIGPSTVFPEYTVKPS